MSVPPESPALAQGSLIVNASLGDDRNGMWSAIEVTDLAKVYPGGIRALDGVSFSVPPGEIFGYLGRNGAGKSTTIRILATLSLPTDGRAFVAGHPVDTEPEEVRRIIGVTMQEAALDELMTAREHVELAARLFGSDRSSARHRAEELLETFGLSDAAGRLVATYSGGMRRRLDVAMSLVHRPAILFLDEPTAGLDPQSRRSVWTMVRELRDAGTTVFLTTQYLEEADQLADRVAIVESGRIAALGSPDELRQSVGWTVVHLRTGRELAADEIRRAFGEAAVSPDGRGGIKVELSESGRGIVDRLNVLRDGGVSIETLSVSQPTLEDVFVRVTGDRLEPSGDEDKARAVGMAATMAMRARVGAGGGR